MAGVFGRVFGKPKDEAPKTMETLERLNETLEMLEKKEKVMQKKIQTEVEKAKQFVQSKNKRAAMQCLKKKKLYEQQLEALGNFGMRIQDQMIMLESSKATTEVVDALRSGAQAMKDMQRKTKIDDVDKTMDEINEQTAIMKQIQESLAEPIGGAAELDEDELLEELEGLESELLDDQLTAPATSAPMKLPSVPAHPVPARTAAEKKEEDELKALQEEFQLA